MALPVVVLLQCCSAPPDDVPAYKPPRARDDEVSLSVDEEPSVCRSLSVFPAFAFSGSRRALRAQMTARRDARGREKANRKRRGLEHKEGGLMEESTDDLLRGLVGRIDALEAARADIASKVEALQSDNVSLNRKVDGLTRDNAILREEVASLKHGESTAVDPRKRSKTEHLKITTLGNDATVHIASFLGANDIVCLGRTCGHFGNRYVSPNGQMTSLVEELAGQVIDGSATDYEKSVLVGGKKIKRLRELEMMRLPLYFKQLIGSGNAIRPHHGMSIVSMSCDGGNEVTAISNHVMRTGKHYVTFHISETAGRLADPYYLDFGVIRPVKDWDKKGLDSFEPTCYYDVSFDDCENYREQLLAEKTDEWGNDLHCCCFDSDDGRCYFASWNDEDKTEKDDWNGDDWEGSEPFNAIGNCTVGLLLNLDSGTLSVFKDGRELGIMKGGLAGAYCWYVCGLVITSDVKIERGMPPVTRIH